MSPERGSLNLGAAGLRGMVGTGGLTPENAIDFASAFGTMCGRRSVLVAHDTRRSSELLANAAIAAIAATGCPVVYGRVLTAGQAQFLIPHLGLDGGMLITGGHQPAGRNALIPLAPDGAYCDDLRRRELFDLYHGRRFFAAGYRAIHPVEELPADSLEAYWGYLENNLDIESIRGAHLTVLGDFCNGAGAPYAERFGRLLNLRLIAMNDTPSDVVPRDPEPRPRSEAPVRSLVRPLGAQMALVFNSDMSRLGLVSDEGEPLSEELTLPLALNYLLDRFDAPRVVTNVCTSRMVNQVTKAHRGTLLHCKVGQAHIAAAMAAAEAVAGGEGNGSFIFSPRLRGADGFLMAGLLLEAVAKRGPLSAQRRELPHSFMVKHAIPCRAARGYAIVRQLKDAFPEAEQSEVDGLRFDWPDGFLSIRLATTESTVRLVGEADEAEIAQKRIWDIRSRLEKTLA